MIVSPTVTANLFHDFFESFLVCVSNFYPLYSLYIISIVINTVSTVSIVMCQYLSHLHNASFLMFDDIPLIALTLAGADLSFLLTTFFDSSLQEG